MGKKGVVEENPQMSENSPWHTMTIEETIKQMGLKDDLPKTGLSTDEAASRLRSSDPIR